MVEQAPARKAGEWLGWSEFERILTRDGARRERTGVVTSHERAVTAYRLRRGFGPTVSQETLDRVACDLARDRDALLAAGVSPELLGLPGRGDAIG